MDIVIIEILDKLINTLDTSKEIKKMDELKKEIYEDKNLKKLLEEYKKESNTYSKEKIEIKKQIIENEKVSEYRKIEDELYLLVLSINKKMKELTEEKSCSI